MDLNRLTGHPQRHFIAKHLGGGGHEGIREGIGGEASAVEQTTPGFDILEHIGEFPANALEISDGFIE